MQVPEYYKPLSRADVVHDGTKLLPREDGSRDEYNLGFELDLKDLAYAASADLGDKEKYLSWVTFTPDYSKVEAILHRKKKKWDYSKRRPSKETYLQEMRFGRMGNHRASKLPYDRRELYVTEQFVGAMHNRFSINVGFITPFDPHSSWDGKRSISIGLLYYILLSKGFDPLLPIRLDSFKKSVESKMAAIIIDGLNDRNINGSPARIKSRLAVLAKDICDFVKSYIEGGVKPSLSVKTLYNRRWRKKRNSGLYGGATGISEALYETGQLCDAVDFSVDSHRDKSAISKIYQKIHDENKKLNKRQMMAARAEAKREKKKKEAFEKAKKKKAFTVDDLERQAAAEKKKAAQSGVIQSGPFKGFTELQVRDALVNFTMLRDKMVSNKNRGVKDSNYGLTNDEVEAFKIARSILSIRGIFSQ